MSRNQRTGLLAAAAIVAVVAVVIAISAGGDDGSQASQPTTTTTKSSTEEPHETVVNDQKFHRIRIKGGEVAGGPQDIKVAKGEHVRIVVSSDAHDDIHLHGYDIEKPVEPGQPAGFNFTANIEGIFEMESHVAEDAGREPVVATLTVEPN